MRDGSPFFYVALTVAALLPAPSWSHADFLSVHIGYVVPQERTPQPNAAENIAAMMLTTQAWYAEQLDRWGFGPKTFRFEGGDDPIVRTVATPTTAAQIRSDIWGQTISAAQGAGLSVWTSGQVWFLISEAHQQEPDGDVIGGTALGASNANGADPGTAMLGGDTIFRLHPDILRNNRTYNGVTIPEIGPYPLVQGASFPSFEQSTFSSIGSSVQGAAIHELGHAFGLPHEFLNDANFNGNVMGNGLRGLRGVVEPELFAQDDTRLSYATALALSRNRYFNRDQAFRDNTRPTLSVTTSGSVDLVNGLLEIDFSGSDASGLAAALLVRNGDIVDQLSLQGGSVDTKFATPYYDPGQSSQYEVLLFDTQGNRRGQTVTITPSATANRAPRPHISIDHSIVHAGEFFTLRATSSSDPDNSGGLRVEWDFDGDGIFDTTPSTSLTRSMSFSEPGIRRVMARVSDAGGAAAISAPIALRVLGEPGDADLDGDVDADDYAAWRATFGDRTIPYFAGDFNGNGWVDAADYTVWRKTQEGLGVIVAVPEPIGIVNCLIALAWAMSCGRRLRRRCNDQMEHRFDLSEVSHSQLTAQ